jgi:peptidoglycan/xylan/chitin deacetylase (PgdA/CDA1 family)
MRWITGGVRRAKRALAPRLKEAAAASGYHTGLYRALGRKYAGAGVIIMLHRVRPDDQPTLYPGNNVPVSLVDGLVRSVRRAGWDIIPLDEIRSRLEQRGGRRFACFTFDDGYADNFTLALPVFRRYQAPMAVYIANGLIDRSVFYWWGALEAFVFKRDVITVPEMDGSTARQLPARTLEEKRRAYDALDELAHQHGEAFFARIQPEWQRAGIDSVALLDRDALSLDQARALGADPLVTIGAHTVSHARLSTLAEGDAWHEIHHSRADLEARLAVPVRHFAYPFGGRNSCGPREFEMAARAGFQTAVTTRRGNIFPEHTAHMQSLPRRNVPMTRRHLLNALYGLESLRRGDPIVQTA